MTDIPTADSQRQILVQRIFLKDASFETPHAPQIFARQWTPDVDVQMTTAVTGLDAETYNVVLSVTVTAKLGNDVAFLAEAHQAGVFQAKGFLPAELQAVLAIYCPNTLFPFVREAVSGMVMRGGFPPLVLQPVNFDALYADHLMRTRAEAAGATARSNGAGTLTQ